MNTRTKLWIIILAMVVLAALFFTATALPGISLAPGNSDVFSFGQPKVTGGAAVNLAGSGNMILRIIYIIAIVLLPVIVILLIFSKTARKQFLRSLIAIIPLLLLLFFFRQISQQPNNNANTILPKPGGAPQNLATTGKQLAVTSGNIPAWLVSATTIGVALIITIIVVGVAWYVVRHRQKSPDAADRIAKEAQNALDALKSGADLKNVVIRCYYQMNEILNQERGIQREEAMTPREFETRLEKSGMPGSAVRELTRLFEEVRYGTRVPGLEDEVAAVASLTAIVDACKVHP